MILLFGGTSDARELAIRLKERGLTVLVSVVTQEAAELLQEVGLATAVGRLTLESMCELIQQQGVRHVVDATAPFAELVSHHAMAAAQACDVSYCRYERPLVARNSANITRVANYSAAAETAGRLGGRILLTTGVKTLPQFAEVLLASDNVELFVRFIPRVTNMRLALSLGIRKQNILAMQGPFGAAFETALYENYSIDTVISKEGGEAGSLPAKLQAVDSLGIRMVLIDRPPIDYVNPFQDMHLLTEHILGTLTAIR